MITVLLDPSQMPDQSQDQQVFDNNFSGLCRDLPVLGQQINETTASINTLFAGGAYAFPFTFDSGTADSDPGNGRLRFNVTGGTSPTVIRMDDLTSAGTNISSLFSSIGANGSAIKGAIRMVAAMDPTKFALFDITGVTTNTGYRNISVAPRGSAAASIFSGVTDVLIFVDRVGDVASGGSLFQAAVPLVISAPASSVDYLSFFTTAFDEYIIKVQGLKLSAAAQPMFQLAVAGGVISSSVYSPVYAGPSALASNPTGSTLLSTTPGLGASSAANYTIHVSNINDTSSGKSIFVNGSFTTGSSQSYVICGVSNFDNLNRVTGFRISAPGANIVGGTIRLFGLRNAI